MSSRKSAQACPCCDSVDLEANPAVLMPFVADRALDLPPALIDESWGLKTIPQGMAHVLCKSMLCKSCGFLFLDLRFDDEQMARLYSGYRGHEYNALREKYEPGYSARNEALLAGCGYVDKIEAFVSPWLPGGPLSVIDWGGDTGVNTPFRGKADKVDVYDISSAPLLPGVRRVDKQGAMSGQYALLVSSMVLEHLPHPLAAAREMADSMREDAVLYVEVPFEIIMDPPPAGSLAKKRHWHEHINFFSPEALKSLMESAGLTVLGEMVSKPAHGATGRIHLMCGKKKRN